MKYYLIYSPVEGGYYDEYYESFRGIMFGTRYDNENTANTVARIIAAQKDIITTVMPIYDGKKSQIGYKG